jgi:simple sugar transport system permease protein
VDRYLKDPNSGALETAPLPDGTWLTRFAATSPANTGLVLTVLVAVALFYWFRCTTSGSRLDLAGRQPAFGRYLGLDPGRSVRSGMLTSGALAGLAGGVAILGLTHAFQDGFSPQYGYLGITVALIGRLHPLGVLAAAVLYACLFTGATSMQSVSDAPFALVFVLQGILILLVTSERMGVGARS